MDVTTNRKTTLKDLQQQAAPDEILLNLSKAVDDLHHHATQLGHRLRLLASTGYPEAGLVRISSEKLATLILKNTKDTLYKALRTSRAQSPGATFTTHHYTILKKLAKTVEQHNISLDKLSEEQDTLTTTIMPNASELVGTSLTVKLLQHAGSLKRLAFMPATTIQLLGAEQALFRFLKHKGKPPKHGILFEHQYIQRATNKGKAARTLADKTSIALKVDYFKGAPIGKQLRKALI